jgi:hypothetical protein
MTREEEADDDANRANPNNDTPSTFECPGRPPSTVYRPYRYQSKFIGITM